MRNKKPNHIEKSSASHFTQKLKEAIYNERKALEKIISYMQMQIIKSDFFFSVAVCFFSLVHSLKCHRVGLVRLGSVWFGLV